MYKRGNKSCWRETVEEILFPQFHCLCTPIGQSPSKPRRCSSCRGKTRPVTGSMNQGGDLLNLSALTRKRCTAIHKTMAQPSCFPTLTLYRSSSFPPQCLEGRPCMHDAGLALLDLTRIRCFFLSHTLKSSNGAFAGIGPFPAGANDGAAPPPGSCTEGSQASGGLLFQIQRWECISTCV